MAKSGISNRHPSSQVKKICETCGAEFWIKRSRAPKRKYCSTKCMATGQAKNSKLNSISYDEIYDLYINRGLSGSQCAKMLGYKNKASVFKLLKKHNIPARTHKETASQNREYPVGDSHHWHTGGKKQVVCQFCGKSFYRYKSDFNKGLFCSKKCSDENKRKPRIKKTCLICGKIFFVKPGRKSATLCSMACSAKARSNQIGRECRVCGKSFYTRQSVIDNGGGLYCSVKCHRIGRRNQIATKCDNCGAKIKRVPSVFKAHTNHFCGRVCADSYLGRLGGDAGYDRWNKSISYAVQTRRAPDNTDKIEIKCSYCGKWYKPSGTDICKQIYAVEHHNQDFNFYCSNECKNECPIYQQVLWPRGFKRASSREVSPDLRQMCLERDGWECQRCGKTDPPLHCHHIDGAVQNKIIGNDLENVITLCKACHKEVHRQDGCRYHELQCKEKEAAVNQGEEDET